MAQRLTQNSFEGGLNTDVSKSKLNPTFYTEAHNVDSVADGDFFALKNIKGTTKTKVFVNPPNTAVLGVFANKYLIGGVQKHCLTVFTAGDPFTAGNPDIFKVWCYDPEAGEVYELFQEDITSDYLTPNRVVDAFGYAENNIDHIYFTDHYNEMRYLRCEIPSPYVANFLSEADISIQRRGAVGAVRLDTLGAVVTGGSLLSGAYQYAYRMVDPVNKRFTKWSSLSSPLHIYSDNNSATGFVYSDYGMPTNFKAVLQINLPTREINDFDYFQVVVVENVYPTGPESITEGENQTFVASLLPVAKVSDYIVGTQITNYEHKTNAKVGLVAIEDIVVDYAAIKNVKTLNVSQKRLVGGNIEYHNLQFDHPSGDPIADGSVITRTSEDGDLFSTHRQSIFRGYFRDEVYRFGIVYIDKYGNRSPVKVLNLNIASDNQISGTLPDMRFPSRATSNSWSLFDGSSPARLRSLGLKLSNIRNHPKWAVGFEIVRAKRIKKIVTQTPLIPMTYVEGIGAIASYPSLAVTLSAGGAGDAKYPDAQPQTTDEIYMPKNLFWPDRRAIIGNPTPTTYLRRGEAKIINDGRAHVSTAVIFPQNFMYDGGVFSLTGAEKIETVDYAALRAKVTDYSSGVAGDAVTTKARANFYALEAGDYYFDPAWAAKTIVDSHKIKGYHAFENLGEPSSLNGKSLMNYEALQTKGVDLGFKPNIQKCVVIDVPTASHDLMATSAKVFASAGTKNQQADGVAIFSSNPSLVYQPSTGLTNVYVHKYSGFSSSYVQAIKIVNITNNYGDDRYGDVDAQHEFISTGSSYFFNDSELSTVAAGGLVNVTLDVWGGDCFISPHTFKVSDGAYSVVNAKKGHTPADTDNAPTLIPKWGKYFLDSNNNKAISLPIGVEGVAQLITVVLESEYNGGVMADDGLIVGANVNNMVVPLPADESNLRSPLTYRYNINLSKQNDQKVYFPRPEFNFEKSVFPARIIYSDQKIYNTDNVGFDLFRVLNFLDLEEKNGAITKLALERDNLYAVQERGVVHLPVGATQITTTDAGQLSVGTSDFFGRPFLVDNRRGGQHIRAIVETGDRIYIGDQANRSIYALAGNSLEPISALNNATLFRDKFAASTTERNFMSFYDPQRHQLWVADSGYCYIFNEEKKQWVTNLEFPAGALRGGVFMNKNLWLIGIEQVDQFTAYTMYTGKANTLFDTVVTPRVSLVVNPDDPITKLFTNQAYIATERLATVDFIIEREQELADQIITGTVLDTVGIRQGGNYRLKLSRAAGNERLRGQRMITTVRWKTDNRFSSLSGVLTKYRHESRTPF